MTKHNNELTANLDKVHTTVMGAERVKRNLKLETEDCVRLCIEKIQQADSIIREGKNWYANRGDCVITVNAHSYTIITARKIKPAAR
jgi:hypothetical protein